MYERSIIAKLQSTKYKGALRHSDKCQNEICQSEMWILNEFNILGQCHGCCFCWHLQYNFRRPQTNEKTYKTTEITEQKFSTFVVCRST